MKTKKMFSVTTALLTACLTIILAVACEPERNVPERDFEDVVTPQPDGLEWECTEGCDEGGGRAEAEKCLFSSPQNWCTAGVRQDKGGWVSGKNICNGVMFSGDAKNWYANAKAKFGAKAVGSTPKVGAIVVWGSYSLSSVGHIGVITRQDKDGKFWYKAMNDFPNGFGKWSERKLDDFASKKLQVKPIGYIYQWR